MIADAALAVQLLYADGNMEEALRMQEVVHEAQASKQSRCKRC